MSTNNLLLILLLQPFWVVAKEPVVHEIIPIVKIAPQYPRKALMAKVEGKVTVVMSINAQGSVDHVEVVEAQPVRIFDEAAIDAGMKFKFKPKVVDGKGVPSKGKITFVFELPEHQWAARNETLLELLKPQLDVIQVQPKVVVLAESVQIKSRIRPKQVNEVHVMFDDDLLQLKSQPFIWNGLEAAEVAVTDFAEKLAVRQQLVQQQYDSQPGVFQRFHRIYSAKNHPPVLINAVDSVDFNRMDNVFFESYRLTINAQGDVVKWQALHNKEINQSPAMVTLVDEFMETLEFLPALKKYQPVESKITIMFKTALVTEDEVIQVAQHNNRHYGLGNPWVRLAAIIKRDGKVADVTVMGSSDDQFEALAVKGLKSQLFSKTATGWQMLELVEFSPKN